MLLGAPGDLGQQGLVDDRGFVMGLVPRNGENQAGRPCSPFIWHMSLKG